MTYLSFDDAVLCDNRIGKCLQESSLVIKCDRLIILATAFSSTVYRVSLVMLNMTYTVHVSFFSTILLFVDMRQQ
jgi:hypothetical protein